jgi:glucose-specific phosphotransferase system IIA component
MGLFDRLLLKGKTAGLHDDSEIVAPVDGTVIPTSEISDPVFAREMMGKTLAIAPAGRKIMVAAPANGLLEVMFPTGHAFGIKTSQGISIMVHIGIDTVDLKGKGFRQLAKQGDRVKAGQPLVEADCGAIRAAGLDPVTMMIITEKPENLKLEFKELTEVQAGEVIAAASLESA